ncbi:hypothetical protein B0H15DRAFT_1027681 [Mycena belliarum]|uniref:Uncharacterized protein n=1 Tax=Mycena belliarum TaxID=1033014 RepID=A0AAD6TP71_9AGAR|nr:hypothetical protein B0H15DRAFT_1027681 [Mycena belliae]
MPHPLDGSSSSPHRNLSRQQPQEARVGFQESAWSASDWSSTAKPPSSSSAASPSRPSHAPILPRKSRSLQTADARRTIPPSSADYHSPAFPVFAPPSARHVPRSHAPRPVSLRRRSPAYALLNAFQKEPSVHSNHDSAAFPIRTNGLGSGVFDGFDSPAAGTRRQYIRSPISTTGRLVLEEQGLSPPHPQVSDAQPLLPLLPSPDTLAT